MATSPLVLFVGDVVAPRRSDRRLATASRWCSAHAGLVSRAAGWRGGGERHDTGTDLQTDQVS
jgi:hypothetical protein